MTIELTPVHEFISARVIHSGAYHDAQDAIRAALLALAEDLQERHGARPPELCRPAATAHPRTTSPQ